jgi:hypothetical protein
MASRVSEGGDITARAAAGRTGTAPVRLSALSSVALITLLSLGSWAVIGGLLYWALR